MADKSSAVTILRHADPFENLAEDVRQGFEKRPPRIPSKYFYDARGTALFEQITRQPEYYLTETEIEILRARAVEIADRSAPAELVEIGAGNSRKAEIFLHACTREDSLKRYVPIDISEAAVKDAVRSASTQNPTLDVRGIAGDFTEDLDPVPRNGNRLVAFFGSTIGNFEKHEAVKLLEGVRDKMDEDDALLLGTDLRPGPHKTIEGITRAYNDPAGVTEEFNKNLLHVLNRELDANFNSDDFRHEAPWIAERNRVEMRLVSERDLAVEIGALDQEYELDRGDFLHTEISSKYDRPAVEELVGEAGLRIDRWFTDAREFFALSLCRPRA